MHVELEQPMDVDLQCVNVQYIMEVATSLINEAVKQKVQQAISFLETNNHDRDTQIPLWDYSPYLESVFVCYSY